MLSPLQGVVNTSKLLIYYVYVQYILHTCCYTQPFENMEPR